MMQNMQATVSKGDFIEIKFTGYVDGKPFDSNISEDLKNVHEKAAPEKTIIIVGQQMVVSGMDKALLEKEFNKEYHIKLSPKEAFGSRRTDLVRTIPLKVFVQQNVQPHPGTTFVLDNQLAKVIAVSGARVITDFNNPLAGKEIEYKFIIERIVTDIKEKVEAVCNLLFKFIPEIELENNIITLKGPKILEHFINHNQLKFKEFLGTEVAFKEVEQPKMSDSENNSSTLR
ncbi:MAG: FKBP-type peptidyl-prolyl cis-trans isomerase [Nanoarchaeota archaeon]